MIQFLEQQREKTMQGTRREIPAYADLIYRLPSKPTVISLQEILRKLTDLDTNINMYLEETSLIKKVSY